jgi:transcriptional regulator with XRE-family HTH domain
MSTARRCRRCASLLAADNTEALCCVCTDKCPGGLAPEVPAEFWYATLLGAALASEELGRAIRMYRYHPAHRRPLHQATLARWLYVSPATLSRIEQGQRHVTIDEIDSFTRALGMPLALRWVDQQPPDAGDAVEPISRRSLLGTAGAGAALGLGAAFSAPASARQIDPALASHWADLLRVLNRHDANFGPHEVLPTVRREIGLIAEHRQLAGGELRTELLRTEARWAEFASWLSDDVGDVAGRDAWAERALGLAHELGDADLVAWLLMWRSQWAADQSDPRRAISFAQAAAGTRGTTKRIRGLSALEEAHGHALAHDAAACERSLAAADGLLGADADADARDDLSSQHVTVPYVLAANARCWTSLAPRKAVATFEDALRAWPDDRQLGRGIRQAQLALGCAAAGELDRAASEGAKALDIAQRTRSDMIVRELRRLDRRLSSSNLPAAAHFRETLATL